MVTDNQVRRYFRLMQTEKTKAIAADKAGIDEKTVRKYENLRRLPSSGSGHCFYKSYENTQDFTLIP